MLVVVLATAGGAAPQHAVGKTVGVITPFPTADGFCSPLLADGIDCEAIPIPTSIQDFDPYDVIIPEAIWSDPDGLLGQFVHAGGGVLVFGPGVVDIGINTNPTVQAWVGANRFIIGFDRVLTVGSDPILGSLPVGTLLGHCSDSGCFAVTDTSGHPNARVLALYDSTAEDLPGIGLLWNWYGAGQSVFWSDGVEFVSVEAAKQIFVAAVRRMLRPAIPTTSEWGLVVLALLLLTAGSVVVKRQTSLRAGAG